MLEIKTPTFVPYVAAIKLSTGEELIGLVIASDFQKTTVSNPLLLVMAPNPETMQSSIMFTPWMVAADEKPIEIATQHILAIAPANDAAKAPYDQVTGS